MAPGDYEVIRHLAWCNGQGYTYIVQSPERHRGRRVDISNQWFTQQHLYLWYFVVVPGGILAPSDLV